MEKNASQSEVHDFVLLFIQSVSPFLIGLHSSANSGLPASSAQIWKIFYYWTIEVNHQIMEKLLDD